ncbi:MAG TPA: hypothetical protein VHU13_01340 [Solirubrobacteraceae bacterium]|nr:hypothetical protein [Solirubrobacteraceae bacterium]
MTERELRRLCRQLASENARLRARLCRKDQQISELEEANANLCVERDATDLLLGVAMEAQRP